MTPKAKRTIVVVQSVGRPRGDLFAVPVVVKQQLYYLKRRLGQLEKQNEALVLELNAMKNFRAQQVVLRKEQRDWILACVLSKCKVSQTKITMLISLIGNYLGVDAATRLVSPNTAGNALRTIGAVAQERIMAAAAAAKVCHVSADMTGRASGMLSIGVSYTGPDGKPVFAMARMVTHDDHSARSIAEKIVELVIRPILDKGGKYGSFSGDNAWVNSGSAGGVAIILEEILDTFGPFLGCESHYISLLITGPLKFLFGPNKLNVLSPGQFVYSLFYVQNTEFDVIRARMKEILLVYSSSPTINTELDEMLDHFEGATRLEKVQHALDSMLKLEKPVESRFTAMAEAFGFYEIYRALLLLVADDIRLRANRTGSGSSAAILREWLLWSASEELNAFFDCFLFPYLKYWRRWYSAASKKTVLGNPGYFSTFDRFRRALDRRKDILGMVVAPGKYFNLEPLNEVMAKRSADEGPITGTQMVNDFLKVAEATRDRNDKRSLSGIIIVAALGDPEIAKDVLSVLRGDEGLSERAQELKICWETPVSKRENEFLTNLVTNEFLDCATRLVGSLKGRKKDIEAFSELIISAENPCTRFLSEYVQSMLSATSPVEATFLGLDFMGGSAGGEVKGTGGDGKHGRLRADTMEAKLHTYNFANSVEKNVVGRLREEDLQSSFTTPLRQPLRRPAGIQGRNRHENSARSKRAIVAVTDEIIAQSPSPEEYASGKITAKESEDRNRWSKRVVSELEKSKVEKFSRPPPKDTGKKKRGKARTLIEDLEESGARMLLKIHIGCFTDDRCLKNKAPKKWGKQWLGCDLCGCFYHAGCLAKVGLIEKPALEDISEEFWENLDFICIDCTLEPAPIVDLDN